MSRRRIEARIRFWAKVDKDGPAHPKLGPCWIWTRRLDSSGYGSFNADGRSALAHRISYEWATGMYWPWLRHLEVEHRCRVTACVNPTHLRPATHKLNLENLGGARRDSRSGIRGVYWNSQRQRWQVGARHNGKHYHGGMFDNLADAEVTAINLRNRLFTYNDVDRAVPLP